MPNKKISQLDQITSVAGTEVVPVVQGGVVKRTTTGAFTGRLKELARAANATAIQDAKEVGRSTLIDGLSAGAVMQQDLKAVSSALHRSPNAVTAMFVYDTSKDSDGGAWTKRCQHTSWFNEPLAGRWLGAHSSELMARLNGAQFSNELVTNGTFDTDTSGWGGTWYNGAIRFQNISATIGQTVYGSGTGKAYLISWSQKILSGSRTRIRIRTAANNSDLSFQYWSGTQDVSVVVASPDGGVTFSILSEVADDFTVDNISIKEILSLATTSNDYYQNTTDGQFYRLYKNILKYSERIDDAIWIKTNATISTSTITAPDGSATAKKLIESANTGQHVIGQTTASISSRTFSVYLKAGERYIATIYVGNVAQLSLQYNLQTNTFSGVGSQITSYSATSVGNGWYRVSVSATVADNYVYVNICDNSGNLSYTGDGTSGLYVWGAQLEYGSTATSYELKRGARTVGEVFRGNKAEFPSLVGIVAEAGSVTLYDLTEAGTPMWMRFLSTAANSLTARALMGNNNVNALSASSGLLVIGNLTNSGYQGSMISMPGDTSRYIVSSGSYMFDGGLSERNIRKLSANGGGYTINSTSINSIATATLTDAPVDSNSGLRAVTVAVATSGGISLIKNGTTVYNSTQTLSFDRVYLTPKMLIASRTGDSTLYYYPNPANISANFTLLTEAAGAVDFNQGNTTALALENRSEFARSSGAKLQLLKHNETTAAKGAAATITPTYNTGYMVGDIKRSYLASAVAKTLSGTEFAGRSLFLDGTQGVWYDPSDINPTWRRNLLTYSEQFDNAAWTKSNATVTPNAVDAPDGTLTADTLTSTGASGYIFPSSGIFANAAGATFTYSVYVKANTSSTCTLLCTSATNYTATYNLNTGVTSGVSANAQASVISAGNGWFRLILTLNNVPSQAYTEFQNGRLANGTSVYIWGAQLEQGSTATPYQRITDGIQDYLSYQAQPVLYRDAAGTQPVTAVEQPVGLMLDKSKGLVLGPELVTNGTFGANIDGWSSVNNAVISWESEKLQISGDGTTAYPYAAQTISGLTIGKSYRFYGVANKVSGANSQALMQIGAAVSGTAVVTNGEMTAIWLATTTSVQVRLMLLGATSTYNFDNISVRELPGNHAFNSSGNSEKFPVLSARYNLLTKTEQFDDAVWTKTNATVAAEGYTDPLGGNTARLMVTGSTASTNKQCLQSYTPVSGVSYKASVFVKDAASSYRNFLLSINQTGSSSVINLIYSLDTGVITTSSSGAGLAIVATSKSTANNGFTTLFLQFTVVSAGSIDVVCQASYSQALAGSYYIWGADLRVANDALNQPAYQRVNTSTDYDTVGFKPYMKFNGTNQWLQTSSIDFTYTDKMFVSAGVRKLSDGNFPVIVETYKAAASTFDSFGLHGSQSSTLTGYVAGITTTATSFWSGATGNRAAPITDVVSVTCNSKATTLANAIQLRINTSSQTLTDISSAGIVATNNFGSNPLFIGAREGSSLWFNGRLYGMVVAGKQASATEIASIETFINSKTSAY